MNDYDRRLLNWCSWFEGTLDRPPLLGEIATRKGWHRSSASNWVKRMQKDGKLDKYRRVVK